LNKNIIKYEEDGGYTREARIRKWRRLAARNKFFTDVFALLSRAV
jgi:hypothetical protein